MNRFFKGFGYAFKGLSYAAGTQLNFRAHIAAGLFAIAMGMYFRISAAEWCWIAASITLVLFTELLNTAIEVLTDLASPGYNAKAGHIKDVSAAAVLIAAIFAAVIACIIFIPKF